MTCFDQTRCKKNCILIRSNMRMDKCVCSSVMSPYNDSIVGFYCLEIIIRERMT